MMICFLWLPRIYFCQKKIGFFGHFKVRRCTKGVTKLGKKLLNLDVHKELKVSNAKFLDLEEDMVEQND